MKLDLRRFDGVDVWFEFLYRPNVIARRLLPKQSPVLRAFQFKKWIATPPKSKSGGSQ